MCESRTRNIPTCPKDLGAAIEMLRRGECPSAINEIYIDDISWEERLTPSTVKNHHALLIGDKELFKRVASEANFFFADATFGCTPQQARTISGRGAQVFNLLADFHGESVCILSSVMTSRKFPAYKRLLWKLKEIFPDFQPANIMSDYEPALRKAITKEYPETRLLGCRYAI